MLLGNSGHGRHGARAAVERGLAPEAALDPLGFVLGAVHAGDLQGQVDEQGQQQVGDDAFHGRFLRGKRLVVSWLPLYTARSDR